MRVSRTAAHIAVAGLAVTGLAVTLNAPATAFAEPLAFTDTAAPTQAATPAQPAATAQPATPAEAAATPHADQPAHPIGKPTRTAPPAEALPGASAPPAGVGSWPELMAVQERLDAAADRIVAQRDGDYTGIEVSPETESLTVYWRGAPPAPATAAIEQARETVDVTLVEARYSEDQLVAEARRIATASGVSAVAPNVDGSGLLVSRDPGADATAPPKATVPMDLDVAAPATASRQDDSIPYWGGARWNGCTSGFAIAIGDVTGMLSAGHCAGNGDTATDGGGEKMGEVSGDSNADDRLYIEAETEGVIYDGGIDGDDEYARPIVGAGRSYVGDYVCASGAYSGQRCNNRVVAVNQTIDAGYLIHGVVRVEQQDREASIGNGDSGGPVYALPADTTRGVAKGIATAVDTSVAVPCTGVPSAEDRICSWRFYYVEVVDALTAYGATILTG